MKLNTKRMILCYCAFCRNPRSVYRKSGSSFKNALQATGLALVSTLAIWERLDPRGLLLLTAWLIIIETVIHMRARAEVGCPHCGFDPVLYVKNQEAACEKVKKHILARQQDPNVWLARRPPLRFTKKSRKSNSTREVVI